MSAIGAIAGGLSQFIQSLNPSGAASGTSNSSSGALTGTSSHHHHHGGGFGKLADAVTNALQSAGNASSGSIATDPNQTITEALTKIFQNGSLGSIGSTASDGDGATAASATDPDATTGAAPSASGLPADFVQTLKSFGVTAQQFQTDFTSALKTAQQSGKVDLSNVFKNFPTGSLVDALG
jgi:hypothetical protein